MPRSSKLCFVGVERTAMLFPGAGVGKRSLQDERVTKQELNNEEKPLHSHHAAVRRGEPFQVDGRPK